LLKRSIRFVTLWFRSHISDICYELKSLESDNRTTLVLSNTRELDKELFYKLVYLI